MHAVELDSPTPSPLLASASPGEEGAEQALGTPALSPPPPLPATIQQRVGSTVGSGHASPVLHTGGIGFGVHNHLHPHFHSAAGGGGVATTDELDRHPLLRRFTTVTGASGSNSPAVNSSAAGGFGSSASGGSSSGAVAVDELVCMRRLHVTRYNVLCCSLAFCVLFSAFNPMQSMVTSLLADGLGNSSLTVIYGTVALVVLFAPAVVHTVGEPLGMLLGGFAYCLFMLCLLFPTRGVLLPCSVVLGCGSAVLWVANGSFLTRCCTSEAERATHTSIFWSLYQLSNVVGQLLAYVLFAHIAPTLLFECFCALGCAGTAILLALKPLPERFFTNQPASSSSSVQLTQLQTHPKSLEDEVQVAAPPLSARQHGNGHGPSALAIQVQSSGVGGGEDSGQAAYRLAPSPGAPLRRLWAYQQHREHPSAAATTATQVLVATGSMRQPVVPLPVLVQGPAPSALGLAKDVLHLLASWPVLCLCPLFFFCGIEFAFWNSAFPELLPVDSIGLVLCFAGVAEVAGGLLLGELSARVGRVATFVTGGLLYAFGLLLTSAALMHRPLGVPEAWTAVRLQAYAAAGCFGFGDAAFNTQLYSLLGQRYPTQGALAFTAFNLVQNIGLAVGFWYPLLPGMQMHGADGSRKQIALQLGLLALALAGVSAAEKHFERDGGSGITVAGPAQGTKAGRRGSGGSSASYAPLPTTEL